MAALKENMEAKGRAKVRNAVRRRMGKPEKEETVKIKSPTTEVQPSPDGALVRAQCRQIATNFVIIASSKSTTTVSVLLQSVDLAREQAPNRVASRRP